MFKLTEVKGKSSLTISTVKPCTMFTINDLMNDHIFIKIDDNTLVNVNSSEITHLSTDAQVTPVPKGTQITLTVGVVQYFNVLAAQ